MGTRRVDAVVIGAGPGGYVAAIRLGQLGKSVLVVEKERLGGACLNVGCIPSKALIYAGKLVKSIKKGADIGIEAGPVTVDLKKVQAWKTGVVDKLVGGIATLLKGNKADTLMGEARFTGPHTLEVKTADGTETVEFDSAVIATGTRPASIPGFEIDEETILSSTGALAQDTLPEALIVIGGGYIGLELGFCYAHLGSKVTVVEAMDQILPGADPDLVKVVARSIKKQRMELYVGSKIQGWSKQGNKAALTVEVPEDGGRKTITLEADKILVSVGRKANTDTLNLAAAGVTPNERGFLPVDDHLRTNVSHIYAIGDVTGPPLLAHKASREGIIAAEVIAGLPSARDFQAMPAAVFTDPEVATVGLTEAEAVAAGHEVTVGRFPFAALGRTLTANADIDGFYKIVADKVTKQVLGVFIVGPDASDLISEGALAVEMGATLEDIALTIHPHPTFPEGLKEAAEAALGRAIHAINK